ncbi:nuclear transport factor 2 family protein [Bacteroidota bacterium]
MAEINLYKALTRKVFEAMNSRDFSDFENILTENAAFDFPGAKKADGKRRVVIMLNALLRKFPKLEFSVSEIIVEDNKACAVWTNEGENTNGEPYANSGVTILHFEDEKICFISDYFKDTSFTQSA